MKLVFAGGMLAGLGLGAAMLGETIPAGVIGFARVGAGLTTGFPLALAAAGRAPGSSSGTAIAAVATAGYTGFLVGAPSIGFISEHAGPRAGLFLVAVRCLVGALLAGTVRRVERPHINE